MQRMLATFHYVPCMIMIWKDRDSENPWDRPNSNKKLQGVKESLIPFDGLGAVTTWFLFAMIFTVDQRMSFEQSKGSFEIWLKNDKISQVSQYHSILVSWYHSITVSQYYSITVITSITVYTTRRGSHKLVGTCMVAQVSTTLCGAHR